MIVFLDTNVILDCILERKNVYAKEATLILNLAEQGILKAFISAGSVYSIVFILQKSGNKGKVLREIMINILKSVNVVESNSKPFLDACYNDFTDLEDAFQYEIAIDKGDINYFVTANIKDFKNQNTAKLPVISPKQLVDILNL